ncbi:MAG TPA: MarR family transcriptional regulator [Allosphingosinicella sp.]|nr:MarR family transcriptional regulator [Allosphingosinicella sp.]
MAAEGLESIDYGSERRLLLFADSEGALARGRRTVELAGGTVADAQLLAGAVDRLAAQVHADGVMIEVEGDGAALGPLLDPLLDALELRAQGRRHGSVVIAPEALIDRIAARTPHRDIYHLCRPSEIERVAAVALASTRRQPRLHDGKEDVSAVLRQLSDEVARIAGMLSNLAEEDSAEGAAVDAGAAGSAGKDEPAVDAALIRSIIRARRLRDSYFKGGIFADPAWDMLLDLMAARLEKHRVAVSSLCIAAAVPPTTALRWIKTLTDRGILVRCADPADGRRVYIELSDEAARALTAYIRAAQRISPLGL